MTPLDPDVCYRALRARDARFDGRVFVGVTTTGIYCRPICPAGPARRENCRFFGSAAAAQQAGFRPCLRCRPEVAPSTASWRGTSNTVARGLALIADGALDGNDVEALAERLGVSARQLRRLFHQHLGASPIAVAQTRRVHFAKQLLHDTRLPMAEIAMAAGFGSLRRFNETFQQLFRRPPGAIRRKAVASLRGGSVGVTGVVVRLRYRPPYAWPAMLSFFRARAVEGVEEIDDRSYRRTVRHEGVLGTVEVEHLPEADSVKATIRIPDVRALPRIVARIRTVFDLDADVNAIGAHLARDPLLAPLVAARPGLRSPGGWDGFELAMRTVLGQQITIEAARRLLGQLVRACGTPVPASGGGGALVFAFPTPAQVASADLTGLALPAARRQTLVAIARAALADPLLFEPLDTIEDTVARLRTLPGVGDWTAHYIALRAAREPDAFPASDIGLLRGAAAARAASRAPSRATFPGAGERPTPRSLEARAERWRPWRAYAAQHLWAAGGSAA